MNKKAKEINRRSKVRSREDYDVVYAFLRESINRRLKKKNYKNCNLFFWVYSENVDEKHSWSYRITRFYTIIYFADQFLYEAMKRRLKRDGIIVCESDKYHFTISCGKSS